MKIVRLILFTFAVSLAAISLFVTFTQEAFLVPVAASILFWETPAVPVLWFLAGSFLIGLGIGGLFTAALWFSMKKELIKVQKDAESREQKIREELAELSAAAEKEFL